VSEGGKNRFDNPYLDAHGIPLNKLGIVDAKELRDVEYRWVTTVDQELQLNPIPGRFDFNHLAAIHKKMFDPIFEWAGKQRTRDFAKISAANPNWFNVFGSHKDIVSGVDAVADNLKHKNMLHGLTQHDFTLAIANVFCALNYIHPFPDGNGRSAKAYLRQLANQAGYILNFDKAGKRDWNVASSYSMGLTNRSDRNLQAPPDVQPIQRIFEKIVAPVGIARAE
jgi:cell filamentation protein